MQVIDQLQENAALGKASAYLQMIHREPEIDVNEPNDASDLVGKPYGLIVMDNINYKFVPDGRSHGKANIHPFLVNWIIDELCNIDSLLNGSTCIELFYEYKRRGTLFCSHPDYHGMDPWHAWVMVTFAMHGNYVISQSIREEHCENIVSSLTNILVRF